ncbi:glycosyltransferase [Pseudooceanicola aestuarii]|uniref:glycosyltransferase n=1 Tax=Pseudooceanicola aestuarii TaxID=2697319 RepID=UPI0013D433F7|nr:glycosyltransferase [Pseudooceanicola aestuarii]
MSLSAICRDPRSVALYFQRLDRAGGGAERMLCQLANALVARGGRVHVVSWDAPGATSFYPLGPGVRWHRLGFAPGWADKARRLGALFRVLRDNRVATLAGFVMAGDMTVFVAARRAGVRLVAAERNGPTMYRHLYSPGRRWINLSLLRMADRILVQSSDFVVGYPTSLRRRMEVLPNPVRTATRLANPLCPGPEGRRVALCVGRLDPVQKRPGLLVAAFARIAQRHPDWDLHLLGCGPARADLAAQIAAAGLQRRVQIRPTTKQVAAAYCGAHLFVLPSLWEGFPNAMAEAMSHGLPALTLAGAEGAAALCQRGGGWVVEGLPEVAALAEGLSTAMSDPQELARRGAAASAAMTDFAPDVIHDRWGEILLRSDAGMEGRT